MRFGHTIVAAGALLILAACVPQNADDAYVAAVQRLHPTVVLLTMKVPPEKKSDGYDDAFASGTVVASGDWGSDILTVQHAIDSAWDLHVTIDNHRQVSARVIAQNTTLDVALLRTPAKGLAVAALGSSTNLAKEIGREVGVLGYPIPDEFEDEELGPGTSLNSGRLSSLRKGALELTLPIVPGESGAPVFLADTGEVIGVAESRFEDERSIGFALPIDDAKGFLHQVDAAHGF